MFPANTCDLEYLTGSWDHAIFPLHRKHQIWIQLLGPTGNMVLWSPPKLVVLFLPLWEIGRKGKWAHFKIIFITEKHLNDILWNKETTHSFFFYGITSNCVPWSLSDFEYGCFCFSCCCFFSQTLLRELLNSSIQVDKKGNVMSEQLTDESGSVFLIHGVISGWRPVTSRVQ